MSFSVMIVMSQVMPVTNLHNLK